MPANHGPFLTLILLGTTLSEFPFVCLSVAYLSRLRKILYRKQLTPFFYHTYSN